MGKQKNALVVFGDHFPLRLLRMGGGYDVIVTYKKFERKVIERGFRWVDIKGLVEPGSIYEASAFARELSFLKLADGTRLAKSFTYKGYELWWAHYNALFLHFCMPYTQNKKMLGYLKNFQNVSFYHPPHKTLFSYYLQVSGCKVKILREWIFKIPRIIHLGIIVQVLITFFSLPILMIKRRKIMIFIGDKFERSRDYDFRMGFIYKELRGRNIVFVELIRSLESWKTIIKHAFVRRRPVIYSEGITFLGRLCSVLSGDYRHVRKKYSADLLALETDPKIRFKILVAAHYLLGVYSDIWSIRITQWILNMIGVKSAIFTATMERNLHAVLGCKLNGIPTVGILHGASSRHYVAYDFLSGFDGKKLFSVDKYGLWSEWWRQYYIEYSRAYKPEQLYVSGVMRPLVGSNSFYSSSYVKREKDDPIKVLFVPGQLSEPKETMPYLLNLMETKGISIYLTFRPYRDAFEQWLKENNPEIFEKIGKEKVLYGSIHEAISRCDVIVGCYSTAVLESLLQLKPLVFFNTNKWGDYFGFRLLELEYKFFAENPLELYDYIKKNVDMPKEILKKLQEKFFGDPYKNGSKWVVDQAEKSLFNK